MSQADLAVGSVFSGTGQNEQWLKMQLAELDRSTASYEHFVYLNQANEKIFTRSTIIGSSAAPLDAAHSHLEGLHALRDFFLTRGYKRYLILDSDCFPVRPDWMELLDAALLRSGKAFAAPARAENLHWFPHPCALYTQDASLLQFANIESRNLLGELFTENQCTAAAELWFPLLRANRRQLHPLLAAVYYDCFYHHGCGSRAFRLRPVTAQYYEHVLPDYGDPDRLLDELMADPQRFISDLRGLSPQPISTATIV